MATMDISNYDFLAGAVDNQEYEHCCEFFCMLIFSVLCDECCLICMNAMLKENFISFYEFVPAAQSARTRL